MAISQKWQARYWDLDTSGLADNGWVKMSTRDSEAEAVADLTLAESTRAGDAANWLGEVRTFWCSE